MEQVLLEKLIVAKLVKSLAFYGTRRFITMFTNLISEGLLDRILRPKQVIYWLSFVSRRKRRRVSILYLIPA